MRRSSRRALPRRVVLTSTETVMMSRLFAELGERPRAVDTGCCIQRATRQAGLLLVSGKQRSSSLHASELTLRECRFVRDKNAPRPARTPANRPRGRYRAADPNRTGKGQDRRGARAAQRTPPVRFAPGPRRRRARPPTVRGTQCKGYPQGPAHKPIRAPRASSRARALGRHRPMRTAPKGCV